MAEMMTYAETMAWGAAQYADVLTVLEEKGLPAVFTQTGGMCAAIEIQLETGHTLLVTDAEDSLAWARVKHEGWGVGMYGLRERTPTGRWPSARPRPVTSTRYSFWSVT